MTPRKWCYAMLGRPYLDAAAAARLQTIVNRTPGYMVRHCQATQLVGAYELIIQDVQAPEWFRVVCWTDWVTGLRRALTTDIVLPPDGPIAQEGLTCGDRCHTPSEGAGVAVVHWPNMTVEQLMAWEEESNHGGW